MALVSQVGWLEKRLLVSNLHLDSRGREAARYLIAGPSCTTALLLRIITLYQSTCTSADRNCACVSPLMLRLLVACKHRSRYPKD